MKKFFLALWPDNCAKQQIAEIQRQFQSIHCRPVAINNFHATLVFMGQVPNEQISHLQNRLTFVKASPFNITFNLLSFWGHPGIYCLTSTTDMGDLLALQQKLAECVTECDISYDARPYVPHVTLARKAKEKADIQFKPISWQVSRFYLACSDTSNKQGLYHKMQSWYF